MGGSLWKLLQLIGSEVITANFADDSLETIKQSVIFLHDILF